MTLKQQIVPVLVVLLSILAICLWAAADMASAKDPNQGIDMKQVEHGRYLSRIAGCNDCHTPGYLLTEGKVPETLWLTGEKFGWRGLWGTTYASNLRLFITALTEDQWVATARGLKARPPMPWFNLNLMHEKDLKAIYQYVRYLGPAGEAAPAYVPPGQEPNTPYALFPSPSKKGQQ